jgi:hypothetical protein
VTGIDPGSKTLLQCYFCGPRPYLQRAVVNLNFKPSLPWKRSLVYRVYRSGYPKPALFNLLHVCTATIPHKKSWSMRPPF